MTEINLHIERVILRGFDLPPGQHGELQTALTAELTRLLSEGALAPSLLVGGAFAERTRIRMDVPHQPEPGSIGVQLAGAVFSGLGGAELGGHTNE
jgi:hypothetical protein